MANTQNLWTIESVVTEFVETSELSRRKKGFLRSVYEQLENEGDITKDISAPPIEIQQNLGGDRFSNCTWAHCACLVLAEITDEEEEAIDYEEACTEFLDAKWAHISAEQRAKYERESAEFDALPEEEKMRQLQQAASRLKAILPERSGF